MQIFQTIRRMRQLIAENSVLLVFLRGILVLFLVMVGHTILFKYLEHGDWNESFWQTWQTMTTVGYGNQPPETFWGRLNTVFLGTLGIAYLGVLISQAFDIRQDQRERRRLGMTDNPIRDGIVIFNYPGEASLMGIIKEIRYIDKNMGFCIVDEKIEALPPKIVKLGNVAFLSGGVLKEKTYQAAALDRNRTAMVFPSEPGVPSADAVTRLIVMNIAKFLPKNGNIVYVTVDPENDWLFEDCPGTGIFESFEILALVQEATDPFSSLLLEHLLLNTSGANPQTVTPMKILGWTWHAFQEEVLRVGRQKGIVVNPLGLVKKGKPMACPAFDTVIEEGDFISVIVYPGFDWNGFEQLMTEGRKTG